jgi:hypothetical protein
MSPRAPRARRASSDEAAAITPPQLDLFPIRPTIDVLDAREVVGQGTAVEHLVRVRFRPNEAPHLVFHDRHGWYCEDHGPSCRAVPLAQTEVR